MNTAWQDLDHLQRFFQLDFLFSGLEVSSTFVMVVRTVMLVLVVGGVGWAVVRLSLKILDCVQTFLGGLTKLPGSFFFALLLIAPLSADSLGARWAGYILLVACLLALAVIGTLLAVAWKYGVDQALRLVRNFRRDEKREKNARPAHSGPAENIVGPSMDPHVLKSQAEASGWTRSDRLERQEAV